MKFELYPIAIYIAMAVSNRYYLESHNAVVNIAQGRIYRVVYRGNEIILGRYSRMMPRINAVI